MEEIKEAKERAETFLNNVITQKWDISVSSFGLKFPFNHFEEGWDWPIRFEAYSYLGHRHRERIPDFATELRTLWNKWTELDNMAPSLKREKIFWPPLYDIVDYDKPEQRAWKFFGNEIESHISMFRAREVLGLVGYDAYFEEAKDRIVAILFSVPPISLSIDDARIIWQIVRSPLLKSELSTYLKASAEEIIKKPIDELVSFKVDRGVRPPSSLFFLKVWTTFFLCFGDFGDKFFDYAKKVSKELIDKQKSDGSFNDSLLGTCLSASIIHAIKVDSGSVCNIAIKYILKEQKKEGYWRFLSGWSLLQDTTAFDVLSTVIVLETLDLITDDEPLPIWAEEAKPIDISKKQVSSRVQPTVPFNITEAINWHDVTIRFLSEEAVHIRAGSVSGGFDFIQMGFADRRFRLKERRPDWCWKTLKEIARQQGEVSSSLLDESLHPRIKKNLKSYIHVINIRLREFFNMSENPFYLYDKKTKSWKTKFTVIDETQE